jgi:hypothetical protein
LQTEPGRNRTAEQAWPVPILSVRQSGSFFGFVLSSPTTNLARHNIGSASSFICCSLHWGLHNAAVPVRVELLPSKCLQPIKINNRTMSKVWIFIFHLWGATELPPTMSCKKAKPTNPTICFI